MAKAKVGAAGIEYIQGAMKRPKKVNGHNHGNYLVATHRTAETTNPNCQRLYTFDSDRYVRSTPVSTEEQERRTKFAAIARMVVQRNNSLSTLSSDQAAYAAQKNEPGGKTTWKSYLWKVCKEAYEETQS
jgi:hypothetical protein